VGGPRYRHPARIAEIIPQTFQRLGLDARFRQGEIWVVWPKVVGPQIATHAQPHTLWHGRLIVHVTDSVWLHHLSMMRHKLVAALNETLERTVAREILFRIGEIQLPSLPDASAPPDHCAEAVLHPTQVARIEELLVPLSEVPFREALRRLLVRAYGCSAADSSRQKRNSPLQPNHSRERSRHS